MARQPFTLVYDPEVKVQLRAIDRRYHSLIDARILEQLRFEPATETRNRKPLQTPAYGGAEWELRFGPDNRFRVLYKIDPENHAVRVLAIGVKERNRPFIGGEEVVP
jgi:mRNA-degrading endonuclease RelE of RelBE toxin-antitoxin system